jgi:tetratricopeptide (TPR) repeat protein
MQALEQLALEFIRVDMMDEALARYAELLTLRETVHGPMHELTLTARELMANCLAIVWRDEQALDIYHELAQLVATHHPNNERLRTNILRGFYYLYEQGTKEWGDTIRALYPYVTNDELFPVDLKFVRDVMLAFAEHSDKQGDHEDAIRAYERVLPLLEQYDGPQHDDTLKALRWMCALYSSTGQHLKALKIARTLCDRTQSFAGERIMHHFDAQIQYSVVHREMKQYETEWSTLVALLRDPRLHQPFAQKFKQYVLERYDIIFNQYLHWLELRSIFGQISQESVELFLTDEEWEAFEQQFVWMNHVDMLAPGKFLAALDGQA